MNKIKIKEDEIKIKCDDSVEVEVSEANKFLNVKQIKIKILKCTDLVIKVKKPNIKIDFYINVLKSVKANIYELKEDGDYKFQEKYYLQEDSFLNIEKVNDADDIKEMVLINLNGEKAKIDFNLKTICKKEEKYNILVYHNAKNTISNIVNNGVNIKEGKLEFNVSGFVPKTKIECDVNQSGRIINMTNNTCTIKPNLFIDENNVVANHSALIGTFSFDEIFYLMSRGISKQDSEMMLTKGFLLKNITYLKEDLEKIINKYWR